MRQRLLLKGKDRARKSRAGGVWAMAAVEEWFVVRMVNLFGWTACAEKLGGRLMYFLARCSFPFLCEAFKAMFRFGLRAFPRSCGFV